MKKSLKRIVSTVLAICFAVTLLTSCGAPGAFSSNKKTVMKIADRKVTYDEYRWFYYNCMIDMEANAKADGSYGELDFSNADTLSELKSNTEAALRKYYAIIYLCDKYGVEMSNDDEKEMNAYIKEYVASFDSKDDYKSELQKRRMTGDVFRDQYAQYYYNLALCELLTSGYDGVIAVDEQTVRADITENFYHYKQIFIPFVEGSDYAEDKKLAEEAYKRLTGGEDFDTVENYVYSARTSAFSKNSISHVTDIYATAGEKINMVESTALALEIGEISKVFWAENGEYRGHLIIKRLPIEEEDVDKSFDTLIVQSTTRRYNEYIEKIAAELAVTYESYYDELSHGMLVSK